MKRAASRSWLASVSPVYPLPLPLSLSLALSLAAASCGSSNNRGNTGGGGGDKPDMAFVFQDDGGTPGDDGGMQGLPNNCGDTDNGCLDTGLGPMLGMPFPLGTDPMKDPNEKDDGVGRDPMGYIGLNQSHAAFDYLWVANSQDWQDGTVSKINSKTVREQARYKTVTCYSLPTGSNQACDGVNGCCTMDDYSRWQARVAKQNQPPHQAVQKTNNSPSRTAIDFNGDLFVANRAFGGQSSVTKIANDIAECKDRNKNGKLDTSSDVNGDGLIQTDCNGNGVQDDFADVKQTPCSNGLKQEFYGIDDECIVWTVNTNNSNMTGRPLGLGPGAVDTGPSDAWAGTYNDGHFFRIDGTTGLTKDESHLPQGCQPYGLVVDAQGYGWSPNLGGGPLCYFNTKKSTEVGKARDPQFGPMQGYGSSLDRDQNIWVGGLGTPDAYRYTPDRTNGFNSLGNGWWVKITNAGRNAGANGASFGVAADSRTMNQYWVWLAVGNGYLSRIPGSDLDKMVKPKVDTVVDGSAFPAVQVAGQNVRGVGVDRDQNLWGISNQNSVATRVIVDKNGNTMPPDINGNAMGNNKCPAGDRCVLKDRGQETYPYTYSDFTGFGLRNFTRPTGTYSYVFKGCQGTAPDTQWYAVVYDADVPPNTSLKMHARVGKTPLPDNTWGPWSADYLVSPADLRANMPLTPFDKDNYFMQVEFVFSTNDKTASPKLKSFDVAFKCGIPG